MSKYDGYIDTMLHNLSADAAIDDSLLNWSSFLAHKKKKRRRFVLLFTLSLLIVSLTGSLLYRTSQSNIFANKSNNPVPITDSIENDDGTIEKINSEVEIEEITPPVEIEEITQTNMVKTPEIVKRTSGTILAETSVSPVLQDPYPPFEHILRISSIGINGFDFSLIEPSFNRQSFSYPITTSSRSEWHWQIQAGPYYTLSSFQLNTLGESFVHKMNPEIRKESEQGLTGFGLNLGLSRTFGKIQINAGLGFIKQYLDGSYDFNYNKVPVLNQSDKVVDYISQTTERIAYRNKHSYSFIEVPLGIQWNLHATGKVNYGLALNYVNQFLLSVNGELPNSVRLNEKDQLLISNYNFYSSSAEFGILIGFPLRNDLEFSVSPRFRYNFGLTQVQGYYQTNLNNFGIQCILRGAL